MVLLSISAVPPRFTAIPKKPPVTVKPLMVISRPRTCTAGWRASRAVIVALPCPSTVTPLISEGMRTFSRQVPWTSSTSPGWRLPSAGPIAAPALQSTVIVAALAGAAAHSASARRVERAGLSRAIRLREYNDVAVAWHALLEIRTEVHRANQSNDVGLNEEIQK